MAEPSRTKPPLVELHLHLEGALTPIRARQLAATRPHAGPVPAEGLGSTGWNFDDLGGFLRLFGWGSRLLDGPESYGKLLEDCRSLLEAQGVVYAELYLAFGQMHRNGVEPREVVPRLAQMADVWAVEGGVDLRFIADATRQWGVDAAERVLADALALRSHRVVGLGMGGDERQLPAHEFAQVFRDAREGGMGTTCHAGEGTRAQSVADVIEHLKVDRIGHGIAAIESPELVTTLAHDQITLEVCPGSNLRTGAWNGDVHPVVALVEAGVPVVLGSDDPAFFGTTLLDERQRCRDWGLDQDALDGMNRHAVQASFLSPDEKVTLHRRLARDSVES